MAAHDFLNWDNEDEPVSVLIFFQIIEKNFEKILLL
jgi:uncharacterized protein YktA (UPF0223 family)